MLFKTISRHLLGKPLENTKLEGEQMPKWKALPIFSSDALSSVGYGPEQIAIVLASVPTLATYRYFGPIVLAIIALLFIVALSYTQVVRVNPGRRRFLWHRHEIPRCLPGPYGRGGASGRLHPDRCRFHFFRDGRRWSVPFRSSTLITSTLTSAFSS